MTLPRAFLMAVQRSTGAMELETAMPVMSLSITDPENVYRTSERSTRDFRYLFSFLAKMLNQSSKCTVYT